MIRVRGSVTDKLSVCGAGRRARSHPLDADTAAMPERAIEFGSMRVVVTGAYGLIGSAMLARLHRDGHELIAVGRSIDQARQRFPYAQWIEADFARRTTADAWHPLFAGIDVVVNCVGVLQDSSRDKMSRRAGRRAPARCSTRVRGSASAGLSTSRPSARRTDGPTAFSRTKAQADAHLVGLDLDWAILRPAWCWRRLPTAGPRCCVALPACRGCSVARKPGPDRQQSTILPTPWPSALAMRALRQQVTWELTHPQTLDLGDIVAALRAWHGFPPRPRFQIPAAGRAIVARLAEYRRLVRLAQSGADDRVGAARRRSCRQPVSVDTCNRHCAEEP